MIYSDAVDIFKKYGVKNLSFLTDKDLKLEYHRLARQYHSDVGGDIAIISDINVAYKTIVAERNKITATVNNSAEIAHETNGVEVTAWIFNGQEFTGYYKYVQSRDYTPCFNNSTEYLIEQERKNKQKVEAIVEIIGKSKTFNIVYIAGTKRRLIFSGSSINPENDSRFIKYLKQEIKSIKGENGFSLSNLLFAK